jgi:uronate dehydrogenase
VTAAGPRGLRVALTGAAGSLAADILPGLVHRGHRIVAVDTRRPMADVDGVTWV